MDEIKKTLSGKSLFAILIIALALGAFFFLKSAAQGNLSSEVRKIAAACRSLEHREQCYAKAFENLTKETDRDYAFRVLRALQQTDKEARGCHFIAHAISTAETQKNPAKWRELMNTAPPDCSYGAAHGALEVYASTFPRGLLPKSEIPYLCDNPDGNNCTHALGHLLLVMNENDIPESLADCESLPHDERGVFECLTGVFMERSTAVNLVGHGLVGPEALDWTKRLPETLAACQGQKGARGEACWKETVHVALVAFGNDFQKLVDMCESAPEPGETRQCIDHGIGVLAGSLDFDFERMRAICDARVSAPDFKERCYAGVVNSTLSTIPTEIPAAKRFCGSIDENYQQSCYAMIENTSQYHSGN